MIGMEFMFIYKFIDTKPAWSKRHKCVYQHSFYESDADYLITFVLKLIHSSKLSA